MYKYADIFLKYLIGEYVELFENFKTFLLRRDEMNVLSKVNELYADLLAITKEKFLELAQLQYDYILQNDYDYSGIDTAWLNELFENFDPIVKYVFKNEADRKRSRMYESVMSSDTPIKEVDMALNYWVRMIAQEIITVTDQASLKAYKDSNIDYLEWVTEEDEAVCGHCQELSGRQFAIDEVPIKPHWKCRCYLIPAQKG